MGPPRGTDAQRPSHDIFDSTGTAPREMAAKESREWWDYAASKFGLDFAGGRNLTDAFTGFLCGKAVSLYGL
jgi:hypothetical protein